VGGHEQGQPTSNVPLPRFPPTNHRRRHPALERAARVGSARVVAAEPADAAALQPRIDAALRDGGDRAVPHHGASSAGGAAGSAGGDPRTRAEGGSAGGEADVPPGGGGGGLRVRAAVCAARAGVPARGGAARRRAVRGGLPRCVPAGHGGGHGAAGLRGHHPGGMDARGAALGDGAAGTRGTGAGAARLYGQWRGDGARSRGGPR
jgi:hypothetical protein